ncbi:MULTISPECIES: hypothetical protein [Bacteroidota]|uniref:hypothetical protein n=1 Tax=Bacteroidota TaxID=976 RepID=UPI0025BD5983|nr:MULTISPECIES: hypothetical protein [Bacteroidota]
MTKEKEFDDIKTEYFNKCTYLGIAGKGKYIRQFYWNNFILSLFLLMIIITWGMTRYYYNKEVLICSSLIALLGISVSFSLAFVYGKYLDKRYKQNLQSLYHGKLSEELKVAILKSYILMLKGSISSTFIGQYRRICRDKIDQRKQRVDIWITSFVAVVLSLILGAFFSMIMSPNNSTAKVQPLLVISDPVELFLYGVCVLYLITYFQIKFVTEKFGSQSTYRDFEESLIALEHETEEVERDIYYEKLIDKIIRQVKGDRDKKSFFSNVIDFFK